MRMGRERGHRGGRGKGAMREYEGKGAMRMGRERGHGGGKGKGPWGWEGKGALRLGRERCHEDGMRKGPCGWEGEGAIRVEGGGEMPNCVRWIDAVYPYLSRIHRWKDLVSSVAPTCPLIVRY
jgi:hypothetical protein